MHKPAPRNAPTRYELFLARYDAKPSGLGSIHENRQSATPSNVDENNMPSPAPHEKTGAGRPVLYDEERHWDYCDLLRRGVPKRKAAQLIGVAPRTIQQAVKKNPELASDIHQCILECHAQAAAQVSRAGEKNWRAAAWVLEHSSRKRGPGRPPSFIRTHSFRKQLKKLIRQVLSEMMPELQRRTPCSANSPDCAPPNAQKFPDASASSALQAHMPQPLPSRQPPTNGPITAHLP